MLKYISHIAPIVIWAQEFVVVKHFEPLIIFIIISNCTDHAASVLFRPLIMIFKYSIDYYMSPNVKSNTHCITK